jgi:anti-sigma-K factor RskA
MTDPKMKLQSGESRDPNQSNESDALFSFLRANAPFVPEPEAGFEDQLMQATLQENSDTFSAQHQSRPRYRWNGFVAAIAALGLGAIAVGLGQLHQRFTSPNPSSAELAQIESFMVNDWDETVRPSETIREWD